MTLDPARRRTSLVRRLSGGLVALAVALSWGLAAMLFGDIASEVSVTPTSDTTTTPTGAATSTPTETATETPAATPSETVSEVPVEVETATADDDDATSSGS